ncbi:class I SAM-dependent methyltransferase [Methylocaldum sp.]|uniref:class I SAM-dependent methyltransferase n=1 Tax=Methylocaldum sp. TaxID=1969727 RepID=UPI002D447451|nr:class I SAM-dependent methyltransferase [Methylocaldum sp.]HYE36435.1 class I SAM-dependent methyltransferase [Methylocaldum sp.]
MPVPLYFFSEMAWGESDAAPASASSAVYGELLYECVACGGKNLRFWRTKRYQYTQDNSVEAFHICRCSDCGTGFLNRPPHADWLKTIYQYSGQALTQPVTVAEILAREVKFPNITVDAARMARDADRLNGSGNRTALDIGSGFGFYTRALRREGYCTVSINPGKYENTVFKELNGDEPIPVMFESFQDSDPFGVVVMSQVLEHLLDPEQAVRKVSRLLASGGVLACAVPNFESFAVKLLGARDNACLWVPEHVNYFTEKGLRVLLERNGFKVMKMEQTTRIQPNALSKRIKSGEKISSVLESLVMRFQRPFSRIVNSLGMGTYISIYAVKS